jgi:putative ABC transport system substrate-binding protein
MTATLLSPRGLMSALAVGISLLNSTAASSDSPAPPRIGVLAAPYASAPANQGLSEGLRELGYVPNQSIVYERRTGDTQDELRSAAADLLRSKVDVIAVFSTPAARAAVTTQLPVVFLVGDPVSTGFAVSLERPGGNATGIALIYAELITRRLEILRRLAPNAKRIGCLMNSSNPASVLQFETARASARSFALQLVPLDARDDAKADALIRVIPDSALDAILVTGDLVLFSHRAKLASAIRKAGLPASFPSREWHGTDVLLSYAPSIREAGRRMATYVDRILKGARAGELPIEQLSKYELVIDLRVAQAMGLDVPEDLLLRADEVIR